MLSALEQSLRRTYFYPLQITLTATNGAQVNGAVQLNTGFDFELVSIQYSAIYNAASATDAFSIIFGTSGGVNFMPTFIQAANILGTGSFPHRFLDPIFFVRGSSIVVTLRNDYVAPAGTTIVNLTFEGRWIQ